MVTWVAPWAAIMLVHYYGSPRQRIDVDALFDAAGAQPRRRRQLGRGGRRSSRGIVATWASSSASRRSCRVPVAKWLDNIDLSWLAGALVAGAIYDASRLSAPYRTVAADRA